MVSVFTTIPGDHECIVAPYRCKANLQLRDRPNSYLLIDLDGGRGGPDGPAVKLDFVLQTDLSEEEVSLERILTLLDWGRSFTWNPISRFGGSAGRSGSGWICCQSSSSRRSCWG